MRRVVGLVLSCIGALGAAAGEDPLSAILRAETNGAPLPLMRELAPDLDLPGAYRLQARYLLEHLRGRPAGGYKAGLTSAAMQERFGTREPIAAVLYREGAADPGTAIDLQRHPGLLVEVELGYVVDRPVTAPLATDADALAAVRAVVPVVELPRVRYADLGAVRGVDLVVTNAGADTYLVGPPLSAAARADLNAMAVTLSHEGRQVAQGTGAAALGNQLTALRWLINKILELGWTVEPGQLFITGTLTPPIPAKAGVYKADFGGAAALEFIGL
jgi:2-keto-4-pentenoate hydratase